MHRKHETSNVVAFSKQLTHELERRGLPALTAPTDGQDRILGADLLATDGLRFVLIEFKDQEEDEKSEALKPLRRELCRKLGGWSDIHAACHLIAWRAKHAGLVNFSLRSYGARVCTPALIGLPENEITYQSSILIEHDSVSSFASAIATEEVGHLFTEFYDYVQWLLSLASGDSNEDELEEDVELVVFCVSETHAETIEFSSLIELKVWLDNNRPASKPRTTGGLTM